MFIEGNKIVFQFYWPTDNVSLDEQHLFTAESLTENQPGSIASPKRYHVYKDCKNKKHSLVVIYLD